MSVKDTIAARLTENLHPTQIEVIDESHLHAGHTGARSGGETHFRVKAVSAAFAGKSRVDRHRMVNEILADELRPDGVHALALELRAPGEAIR